MNTQILGTPVSAVLSLPVSASGGVRLAEALGCPAIQIECHRFPDGETRVRVPPLPAGHIVLYASLDDPDAKLVTLMLAASTARDMGARPLTLVAPYLCYMRQDVAFRPGEAVSQRIVGRFLAGLFDAVVTVDPHLHRVSSLAEAVPAQTAIALSAAPAIGRMLREHGLTPLLLAPDEEALQWVSEVAAEAGLEHAVCTKRRSGDRLVEVRLPEVPLAGREVMIVDDVASTGRTLIAAARQLIAAGAASVDVAVTHPLFVGDALDALRAVGVRRIWSGDGIPHPTNAIRLAPLIASALAGMTQTLS